MVGSRWVKTAEKTRAQKSKVQVGEEGVVLLKNNTNKKINFLLICFYKERFPECSLMFIPKCLSLVTIWVCLEGAGVDDSFVIYQLVRFVLGESEEFIGVRIPDDLIGVNNLEFSWLEEGVLDFVEDILSHDIIVELCMTFAVESEASDLAFDLLVIGNIAIILGSSANEFFDVFLFL